MLSEILHDATVKLLLLTFYERNHYALLSFIVDRQKRQKGLTTDESIPLLLSNHENKRKLHKKANEKLEQFDINIRLRHRVLTVTDSERDMQQRYCLQSTKD